MSGVVQVGVAGPQLSSTVGRPLRYALLVIGLLLAATIAAAVALMSTAHSTSKPGDAWQQLWDLRLAALETVLGPAENTVYHSPIPFYLDGAADVVVFRNHVAGVAYVTADLIGDDRSKPSELGQYELMICLPRKADWAPNLISNLAKYTIDAVLSPGDTMAIAPALPQPTRLVSLLFVPYAELEVQGKKCGLLLCLGITEDIVPAARS